MRKLTRILVILAAFPTAAQAQTCTDRYVVAPGDDLVQIARKLLGDPARFREIYAANAKLIGADPSRIEIGMNLLIPCRRDAVEKDAPVREWRRLVDAGALDRLRRNRRVQIVDVRAAGDVGKGTIAGAISVPYEDWRNAVLAGTDTASNLALSALVGASGIRLRRPIIVVNADATAFDAGRAAFVYWVLKSAGAGQLALLKGGIEAWRAAGLPISQRPARKLRYRASLSISDTWRARRADIAAIARRRQKGALIDSRAANEYSVTNAAGQIVPSTLARAVNSPVAASHAALLKATSDSDGVIAVLARLKGVNVNWERAEVITFCETGELSALNWFYASEIAGIRNVKYYPEAVAGWVAGGGELVPAPQ